MDFKSFLRSPERRAKRGMVGRMLATQFPQYADLLFDQGFHSSPQIKDWMNEHLNRLLPGEKHPIAFDSLPFPTYIVSTDLRRSEAKLWSQRTTPKELVADAVQASCAIPIFFQPVAGRYLDGGLLSNLPSFVFFDREQSPRALASRVLAFTLVADDTASEERSPEAYFRLLADAVVEGAQQLQLSLQGDVTVISISTGDIRPTDFHKMT